MSAEHRNECTLESCSGSHDGLRPLRSTPADDRGASSPGQRPQQNAATISSPNTILVRGNGLVSNETKVHGGVSRALMSTIRPMCFFGIDHKLGLGRGDICGTCASPMALSNEMKSPVLQAHTLLRSARVSALCSIRKAISC